MAHQGSDDSARGDNGFNTSGDHGVFEQLVTRNNRDSGFQIRQHARRSICRSIAIRTQTTIRQSVGENADGFAVKIRDHRAGQHVHGQSLLGQFRRRFRHFWHASQRRTDDRTPGRFDNGLDPRSGIRHGYQGDGNGFKLGTRQRLAHSGERLGREQSEHGIDINGNGYDLRYDTIRPIPNGSLAQIYNSTSFDNGNRNFTSTRTCPHTACETTSPILAVTIIRNTFDRNTFVRPITTTWNGAARFAVDRATADFASDRSRRRSAATTRSHRCSRGAAPGRWQPAGHRDFLRLVPAAI